MFAVIYRFKLKSHQEDEYQQCWRKIASYFIAHRGAIGSCLHKAENGLWIAYSRWPDKATREAAWPRDDEPNQDLPVEIRQTIQRMQVFKEENKDLEQYDDICMNVVDDLLIAK